jgi:hypothetical protein
MKQTFEVVKNETQKALELFDEHGRNYSITGKYPFIIGDDKDLRELEEMIEPPNDGGAEIIEKADSFDLKKWFKSNKLSKPKNIAKNIPQQSGTSVLYNILTGELKPEINIGLIEVVHPCHIFAKLGYGGWNECPDPEVHVALHRYWNEKFGSIPLAVTSDTLNFFVPQPITEPSEVLLLAAEQYVYCRDIVEQDYGSKSKLAALLVGAKIWSFWWD